MRELGDCAEPLFAGSIFGETGRLERALIFLVWAFEEVVAGFECLAMGDIDKALEWVDLAEENVVEAEARLYDHR
jgi:hypothetical protein